MKGIQLSGVALVTGASSGIGEEFARQLAAAGCDLIITARRRDRLEALRDEIAEGSGRRVEVLEADLSTESGRKALEARVRSESRLTVLVNNAGFGISGNYIEQPVESHQRMIDVHITAVVRLCYAAVPGMLDRGLGFIINVSSIAAFIPAGGGPGYSASKAYLNSFSANLQSLVAPSIRIQALCPGYTYTEFHNSADYQGNERQVLPKWAWMTSEQVVDCSLRSLKSGKVIVIPGLKNRLVAELLRSSLGGAIMGWRSRHWGRGGWTHKDS